MCICVVPVYVHSMEVLRSLAEFREAVGIAELVGISSSRVFCSFDARPKLAQNVFENELSDSTSNTTIHMPVSSHTHARTHTEKKRKRVSWVLSYLKNSLRASLLNLPPRQMVPGIYSQEKSRKGKELCS